MIDDRTQQGYLVLADISGYTSYLAGAELTHAQDVLTELLELIVAQFRPLLAVVKLEGDAVFAHVPEAKLSRGELLLDLEESTYLAFRDRVESIRRRTTCDCRACRSIPGLDLKFVVHNGEYLTQNVSGITELVGSDVNLAHRLLKNHVSEATGWKAYALFTEAALEHMGVDPGNLHVQREQYEHLGDVITYSLDLHARHQELIEARRRVIKAEESDLTTHVTLPAPPIVVWEWLNDIQKRLQWETYTDIRPFLRPGGRLGAGAQNHCAHGRNVVLEKILDWRPFEYYTIEYPMALMTRYLDPVPGGTQFTTHYRLKLDVPAWLKRLVARLMHRISGADRQFRTLAQLVADEAEGAESLPHGQPPGLEAERAAHG